MGKAVSSRRFGVVARAAAVFALCAMAAALCVGCNSDDGDDDTYKVTFSANGGNGTAPGVQSVHAGYSITLPNQGSLTKNGYNFDGWSADTSGTEPKYSAGSSYTPTGNVTLYARWIASNPNDTAYTVTFDHNGGSGTPPVSQTVNAGFSITLPSGSSLTRIGYTFNGWNADTSGTGTNYSVGSSYIPTGNITLYANWVQQNVTTDTNTFIDGRDSKSYKKVKIGNQVWMAENLNCDVNGSKCYGNSADNCVKYGRLYNWATAMNGASASSAVPSGVQGVCPVGWHLPSDAEWDTLVTYVGNSSKAGTKLKSATGWRSYSGVPVGTNEYGFSALPGGIGYSDGSFSYVGDRGDWWSTTEYSASNAWNRGMHYDVEDVPWGSNNKSYLFSVRCVAN